ncbi:hypothetical protein acdb102_35900 [Acidothermaceae bacterium B102]|nr:hypothetical protein acdb102_35900 [Acidothermaceae bacterium B102]
MATMDELAAELQRLQDEVRVLRAEVATPPAERKVLSRRNLLRAAPIAAIGGAMTAMAASPAAAAPPPPVLLGRDNDSGGPTTSLESAAAFHGSVDMFSLSVASDTEQYFNADQPLVTIAGAAVSQHPFGQDGLSVSTVDGGTAIAVSAVDGPLWQGGPGELAFGTAVRASTQGGTTVAATTDSGQLFVGETTSASSTADAVTVSYAGTGHAVLVEAQNASNTNGAVTGVAAAHGIGVVGVAGASGRGAQFTGGIAAARLVPSSNSTHPWSGKVGDLMVDASARLWFCSKTNTASVAATWKQIA